MIAIMTMPFRSLRAVGRRSAIASAFVFLGSAAAFFHYGETEAHARGFNSFTEMRTATGLAHKLAHL
ncbi:hypothetical protein P7D22_11225 [Lichenihabitans sp. Uapishka_5]|uniref:hypothetical protein n=1 Tax=Lichenihabitans sp. Uapishka_5 TaxID=3037302 RepID=UPI0029E7F1C6|nr:hypothetical protein [Lichenihabitans sp. Uapishka_5]MDX7951739.1 hypothetical protein [Lichenihabitans sp. Uapishka_5]